MLGDAITEFCHDKNKNYKILEVGAGRGESTELFIKSNMQVTFIEPSPGALAVLKSKFSEKKHTLVRADALEWIKREPPCSYEVVTASWVLHNFPAETRDWFIKECYRILKKPGLFAIFDKILQEGATQKNNDLFNKQIERLRSSKAIDQKLFKKMIAHEKRDISFDYVWYENDLRDGLDKLGFDKVIGRGRHERDMVLFATKN